MLFTTARFLRVTPSNSAMKKLRDYASYALAMDYKNRRHRELLALTMQRQLISAFEAFCIDVEK
jgi:hypothetical protein